MEATAMRVITCDCPTCKSTCELPPSCGELEPALAKRGWFTLGAINKEGAEPKVFHFCPIHRTMTLDEVSNLTQGD